MCISPYSTHRLNSCKPACSVFGYILPESGFPVSHDTGNPLFSTLSHRHTIFLGYCWQRRMKYRRQQQMPTRSLYFDNYADRRKNWPATIIGKVSPRYYFDNVMTSEPQAKCMRRPKVKNSIFKMYFLTKVASLRTIDINPYAPQQNTSTFFI